jgi:cathepsin F
MRSVLALLVFTLLFSAILAKAFDAEVHSKFSAFEKKYSKSYSSPAERAQRLAIFAENLQRVEAMNAEHDGQVFGVTKFMDLSPEEFKAKYLNLKVPSTLPEAPVVDIKAKAPEDLPTEYDWRNNGSVITPVKNQEQCGSCWAFSATESVEAAWVLAGNTQSILAPQQIVDCDTGDSGCNGGYPSSAFEYIIKNGGLDYEKDYPYKGVDGSCKFKKADVGGNIVSWHYVSQQASDETTKMLTYVAERGPVSVCVDAAPWQYYTGGVLKTCGSSIDHAVQATGYGVQNGVEVWNVRNSWGEDWGEQGYIWLERGKNLCEIATIVTAAVAQSA